jgi:tetratricopeptide (TPR) repeat protein
MPIGDRAGERGSRAAWLLVAAFLLADAAAAYWALYLAPPAKESPAELMKAGLDALYQRNDPDQAAARFRQVLERRPAHYAATYQLAVALDRAGAPDEARPYWQQMLSMAESAGDDKTAATARSRLNEPR